MSLAICGCPFLFLHHWDDGLPNLQFQPWDLDIPVNLNIESTTDFHRCAVSPEDFAPSRDGKDIYLLLNGRFVVTARPTTKIPPGYISLSDPQRTWCDVGMRDPIVAERYDPLSQGLAVHLGSLDCKTISHCSTA
jgi:hypothetical protein